MDDDLDLGSERMFLPSKLYSILLISTQGYAWVISIFFFGYLICEVPSNMILSRTRPSIFLPGIMLVWGALSAAMAAAPNYGSLLAFRFILGCIESGFFPGVLFVLSCWYTTAEIGMVIILSPSPSVFLMLLQENVLPFSTVLQRSLEHSEACLPVESRTACTMHMELRAGDGSLLSRVLPLLGLPSSPNLSFLTSRIRLPSSALKRDNWLPSVYLQTAYHLVQLEQNGLHIGKLSRLLSAMFARTSS